MSGDCYADFDRHVLDGPHAFYTGELPPEVTLGPDQLGELWEFHPAEFHEIKMMGRPVKTPRWQQAFDENYHYTGRVNVALPLPELLQPLKQWVKTAIDPRLNGALINWYEGRAGHYIGRHRDSTKNMIVGAPIVTVSFGEERIFRLRPWKGSGCRDFAARHGSVFVMPYETNRAWTHEVPHAARYQGQRISVTWRAFEPVS